MIEDRGNMEKDRYNFQEIDRAIKLITLPGEVYELRTVNSNKQPLYGYFNDPEKLASAAKKVSGTSNVQGVYLTINPVKPELLARTGGKDIRGAGTGSTTSDKDVLKRAALVVDIDSDIRAKGISATNEEKESALILANKVKEFLVLSGWPNPLLADSGNGYHLRWNIDLPNDQDSRYLVEGVLKSLAQKFNDGINKIDTVLYNASRICKLYGTLSAKGADMPDRPHRINYILEDGDSTIVPKEKLLEIAGDYTPKEVEQFEGEAIQTVATGLKLTAVPILFHNWKPEEMETVLDAYGITYNRMEWENGWKWQITCVFNEDHKSPDAYTMLMPSPSTGKFYPIYKCSHDSCSVPRWKAFISKLKQDQPEVKVELFEKSTQDDDFYEEPIDEYAVPALPLEILSGDYLGDLSSALTDGTFIPMGFARATLKTILGTALDGKVGFPGEEFIHMRHWNALISSRPEAGKGEIWKRLYEILKGPIFQTYDIELPKSGFFSSGEHAIKTLAMNDGKPHLAYFDEMKVLFEKGSGVGSTLFSRLLELYEQTSGGVGSLTHNTASFENVSLSMTGGFTIDGFEHSISGKGVGGDGFLSRMILEYSDGILYEGDWKPIDGTVANAALKGIRESLQYVYQKHEEVKDSAIPRFVPIEDEDAKMERMSFQKWLNQEKKDIEKRTPGASYASRIESHFKRDLLLRAIFSPEKRITKEFVIKSIRWAMHQLELRQALWPIDRGNDIEKFEKRILKAFREYGPLSKASLQRLSGAEKGSGGFNAWNPAWKNIIQSGYVALTPFKNKKKQEVFGLRDQTWNPEEKRWIDV
jgi:hypothetical protein